MEMALQPSNPAGTPISAESKHHDAGVDIQRTVMAGGGEEEDCCQQFIRIFLTIICGILLMVPIFWIACIKVVDQHERLVHFRLGKVIGKRAGGPGIFILLPCIDEFRMVDLRVVTYDLPVADMMTKDSVTVKVNAVVFYYVADPIKAILCTENYVAQTTLTSQSTLRQVVGQFELDGLLSHREKINHQIQQILDENTNPWGIKVLGVEIKDVRIPFDMQRSMGSQAEAERERRGKIISAEGELQASAALLQAANNMTSNQSTMQLRYLQTLNQISQEKNSTVVFPLPMSLLTVAEAKAVKMRKDA